MAEVPSVKSVKVYATVESVVELPRGFSISAFFDYLRHKKFGGETHVNSNQGGVTNVINREHIPMSMQELDVMLSRRTK